MTGELKIVRDGTFTLDPGAAFGITPREVWSRSFTENSRGRVSLTCNTLLIQEDNETWLVDAGLSERYEGNMKNFFEIRPSENFWKEIDEAAPEGIDHFLISHLHFDHIGRAIDYRYREKGRGRGDIICQAREVNEMRRPGPLSVNSYPTPLLRNVRIRRISGSGRIKSYLFAVLTGGHTSGHQAVIYRGRREIIYFGDLVPTTFYARLTHITAIDSYPMETIRMKRRLIMKAIRERAVCVFNHDSETPCALLSGNPEKPSIEPVSLD